MTQGTRAKTPVEELTGYLSDQYPRGITASQVRQYCWGLAKQTTEKIRDMLDQLVTQELATRTENVRWIGRNKAGPKMVLYTGTPKLLATNPKQAPP